MDDRFDIEERDGYLYFFVQGADSVEFSVNYWNRVSAECRQRGFEKALVVENLTGQLSTLEVHTVGKRLPEILAGLTVAFVDRVSEDNPDNQFAEDVAVNRGTHVRIFNSESEAIAWLKEF